MPFELSRKRTHGPLARSELVVLAHGPRGVNLFQQDEVNSALLTVPAK